MFAAPPAETGGEEERAPPQQPLGRSQQRRLRQQRLLLLHRQGLALALLRNRAGEDGKSSSGIQDRHRHRRRHDGAPRLIATLRCCGTGAKQKAQLPSGGEMLALQADRHLSRRRRRVLKAKEIQLRALARQRAQQRARLAHKRRYKHKRKEELERQAARRVVRVLKAADVEDQRGGGGRCHPRGGLVAWPIAGPHSAMTAAAGADGRQPLQQPWGTARARCESMSALVQQALRASRLPPPPPLSGLFDQLLIVGLPLEALQEPFVHLAETYAPQVVYAFPDGALCAEAVADFCLPQGVTPTAIDPFTGQPQPRPPRPASSPLPSSLCSRQRAALAAAALEEAREILFVLSGGGADGSETAYGMCLHLRRPYLFSDRAAAAADVCYCFIAKQPFLPLHLGVLRDLARMHLCPPSEDPAPPAAAPISPQNHFSQPVHAELEREKQAVLRITQALHRFAVLPVPAPGEEVAFNVFQGTPQALALPTYFRRPAPPQPVAEAWGAPVVVQSRSDEEDDEATRAVREWAAPVLLSLVGVERVLLVLLGMLTEAQVVLVSPDAQVLSASVLALAALVRPLVWAGPVITMLPSKHSDYLDSPVPLIVGVEALPHGFQQPKGMILVYPERDAVVFHPEETGLYQQLLGRQVEWLLRSLPPDVQRRPRSHRKSSSGKHQKEPRDAFPAPRAASPAYGAHRHHPWCGSEARSDDHHHGKPQPPHHARAQLDRLAVEEVVWRVREHIAAVAEAALSLDLLQRPRRPSVLTRRRSSALVEERTLESEEQAWWEECLGMEGGALFMKRFMETQMYSNYRHSDAARKRSVSRAAGAGAFAFKHRSPSRPIAFHPRMTTALAVHETAFSSPSWAELQGLDGSSASPFPHQEQLTELFSMAMFGGTAALTLAERHPREALAPLEEAGLLYRPCNGMCGGRCDTENCTEICLELWQHKLVQVRRRQIVRNQRFLALPHARPYAHWRPSPSPTHAPHRLELPSQYRRRLLLARGEETVSRRLRQREKGWRALRFQLLLQIASQRQQVERHAGLAILGALRRHHARQRMARLVRGIVRLQALWRGHRRRQELYAGQVINQAIHRFRLLKRWHNTVALALAHQQQATAAAALAPTPSGLFSFSSPRGSGSGGGGGGGGKSPRKEEGGPRSGGGLWGYLTKRSPSPKAPSPVAGMMATGVGVVSPDGLGSPGSSGQQHAFSPDDSSSYAASPQQLTSPPGSSPHAATPSSLFTPNDHRALSPTPPSSRNSPSSGGVRVELPTACVPERGSDVGGLEQMGGTGEAGRVLAAAENDGGGDGGQEEEQAVDEGEMGGHGADQEEGAAEMVGEGRIGSNREKGRLPPRLLAAEVPALGRQLVPSEKAPLPLSALRRGLRVHKLDRRGKPHTRLLRLEDQGPLAYSPRLTWRPPSVAGRALRALLASGKPCTLKLSDAVGGVDSSGQTPRIVMALTHHPPLLRPAPGTNPPRHLVFAVNDGDRDYEFVLGASKGMGGEAAVELYMRLLATLQTLCAQAAPHSPSTPKP